MKKLGLLFLLFTLCRAPSFAQSFPTEANAYFLGCVRKCYGKVHMTITKGDFPSNFSGPGIISSVDFNKGADACHASWTNTNSSILVSCINENLHISGISECCPGYGDY
jgi:hypothetical protein